MAKKKKGKKKSKKLKQIVSDTCRQIEEARDQITDEINSAAIDGRHNDIIELIYLDGRFKDIADRLNCSGTSRKPGSGKSLVDRYLKSTRKAKK